MWKTALFLVFTIIAVPIVTYFLDSGLTELQTAIMSKLLLTYLAFALLTFVVSALTKNYSQVDKLWSIMPIVYVWMVFYYAPFEPRLLLMAALVTIWGIRLTYNFSRRGGYSLKFWSGEEDYRWSILKARKEFHPEWKWTLFNLFFISLYQMALILLITFPILKSIGGRPMGIWDMVISIAIALCIVLESIADQQQWNFQNQKRLSENKDNPIYAAGFLRSGLWAIVRHPNYANEQAIWVLFYFFTVTATGLWVNWSISGCLLLILLFKGSADFSESISARRYPEYQKYINEVPRFAPSTKWLLGKAKKSPEQEVQGL